MTLSTTLRLALALSLTVLAACAREEAAGPATTVQPAELAALLDQAEAPLLLDVRTPEEFAAGHVPGARLIPIQELESRLGELEAYQQRGVVAYCEAGGRASRARELLREHGFTSVRLLDGSMRRWRKEGRAVETGS